MFCICVLIIAAAAVYMVEAYIHTYYAIEYMHGAPLFFVLLAKYAAPTLFLLLCGYFVFRYREKRQLSSATARISPTSSATCLTQRCNSKARFCPRSCSKRQPPRGEQRATGNTPGR